MRPTLQPARAAVSLALPMLALMLALMSALVAPAVIAQPAPPAAQPAQPAQQAAQGQDPNLARNLAATCANCHGTNGNARGEMRPLAGLPAQRIVQAFNDYKSGAVPATVMHQISKGYTDAQIRLIAEHFAAQKPQR